MHKIIFLLLVVISLVGSGCSKSEEQSRPTLTVAAAANLQLAFKEIGELYTEKTGVPVEFNFGNTGILTQQILNGAPIDVFAAANVAAIDDLLTEGLILKDSKKLYAKGRIVVAKKKGVDVGFDWDLLKNGNWHLLYESNYKNLAMANPEHAPYGLAAKEFLVNIDIWDKVQQKIIYGTNIQDALNYISSGNAEIGFVALSIADDDIVDYILIPEEFHLPLNQGMAIISSTALEQEARGFTELVLSNAGQEILEKYGYVIP